MNVPVILRRRRFQYGGGVVPFSPLSLFASGEEGAWYEPSTTTAFLSTTDLTPCGYGDACGFLLDKSQGAGYSGGSFTGLGSELVTNGTFDTDVSGWTLAGGTAAVDASGVTLTNTSSRTTLSETLSVATGKVYRVTGTLNNLTSGANSAQIRITSTNNYSGTLITSAASAVGGDIEFEIFFVAPANTLYIWAANNTVTAGNTVRFDNISVRELPGNHATQGTEAARPILARVPEGGRRNLLERTEEFDNAYWTKSRASIDDNGGAGYSDPDGGTNAVKLVEDSTASTDHRIFTLPSISVRNGYFDVKASERTWVYIRRFGDNLSTEATWFNLASGVVGTQGADNAGTITSLGDGWYRCAVDRGSSQSLASGGFFLGIADADGSTTYNGDGSSGVLIYRAQGETTATATAYQKVVDQYDITEAGVTSLEYLAFDGSDDFLALPDIPYNSDTGVNAFMGADTTDLQSDYRVAWARTSDTASDSFGPYFGGDGSNSYKPLVFDQANIRAVNVVTQAKAVFSWQVSLTSGSTRTAITRVNQNEVSQVYSRTFAANEVFNGVCGQSSGAQMSEVKMFAAVLRCAAPLTAQEISDTESYVANLSGVTL